MISLDLDGTLLRTDKTLGPRTKEALHAAHAKGIKIVLASGRMISSIERVAGMLDLDVCIVSCNGAAVFGPAADGRKPVFYRPLNADVARELVAYAKQHRYQVNFYQGSVIYSEDGPHLRPWIDIYSQRTGSFFKFVENLDDYLDLAPPKVLYVVDPDIRNAIQKELMPRFGSRVNMMRTDPEYLEFLEPGIDKGVGLTKLAEALGIPMGQVMAMGDGENDIAMLEVAGWPVAVANASPLCKAVGRFFTQSDNNHDAVAEAIERWTL
jgi:Cof subfamily protein (haloacid dehalogenase superfamily)